MKMIHPDELKKLGSLAEKACGEHGGWEGQYPAHILEHTYRQERTVDVDGFLVEVWVVLHLSSSPGFGLCWIEHRRCSLHNGNFWLTYSALGGIEACGPVDANGECLQGVTRDELMEYWVMRPEQLVFQRPAKKEY